MNGNNHFRTVLLVLVVPMVTVRVENSISQLIYILHGASHPSSHRPRRQTSPTPLSRSHPISLKAGHKGILDISMSEAPSIMSKY